MPDCLTPRELDSPRVEAWTWLIDLLAADLAARPAADARAILNRLDRHAGLDLVTEAESLCPQHFARRRLVDALLAGVRDTAPRTDRGWRGET